VDTATLQKYSLFGGLLPGEIDRVKPLFGAGSFATGDTIMAEGLPNDRIYFIVEGRVEVSKRGAVIVELGEGETFGEMEILDVMPSVATVRAVLPTSVATISNQAIHQIFKIDSKTFAMIVMNLARDLSRRLRRMDELFAGCEAGSPSVRPSPLR
jgi:CRP/FNR family cyclic AMP-dependent transcriptional regulator